MPAWSSFVVVVVVIIADDAR
jgi:hypothetical protein